MTCAVLILHKTHQNRHVLLGMLNILMLAMMMMILMTVMMIWRVLFQSIQSAEIKKANAVRVYNRSCLFMDMKVNYFLSPFNTVLTLCPWIEFKGHSVLSLSITNIV